MKGNRENHPFRIGLVGGLLQGMEAAYLAREAGYHVTVIDRNPEAPALTLAHQAHVFDVHKEPDRFHRLVLDMDAILPTTEEDQTLDFLEKTSRETRIALLHDASAYFVSSSKVRSNALFANHNIPFPDKWPECNFPVIVKPSGDSGSHGVQAVPDRSTLDKVLARMRRLYGEIVIEAYHKGPSLSLEVITQHGRGIGYLVTELEFDAGLDCKRVYAPSRCSRKLNQHLEGISLDIARHLELNGLMDIEVIADPLEGNVVVLEIDARFPSQTPMAVYHASGINLLEEWVKVKVLGLPLRALPLRPGCALLEHVAVRNGCLEFIGETHLLPWHRPRVWTNGSFFDATVALTDYQKGKESFKSTLIFTGPNWSTVLVKRQNCLDQMVSNLALKETLDAMFQMPQN